MNMMIDSGHQGAFQWSGREDVEHFDFVLLDGFSVLSLIAAMEPLQIANKVAGEVHYKVRLLSCDGKAVTPSNGRPFEVDASLDDTARNTRIFVLSEDMTEADPATGLTDWLRYQWMTGRTVCSVDASAFFLAKSGILKGAKFALNWRYLDAFQEKYPTLNPSEDLYTNSRRIWSCSGGYAATDLVLSAIRQKMGREIAGIVQERCGHCVVREGYQPQRPSIMASIGNRNPRLCTALEVMRRALADNPDLNDVAKTANISRRQMERLFARYLGCSPRQYLDTLQLNRAQRLLASTELLVIDVAMACGFSSSVAFSRKFKAHFGVAPSEYRATGHERSQPLRYS